MRTCLTVPEPPRSLRLPRHPGDAGQRSSRCGGGRKSDQKRLTRLAAEPRLPLPRKSRGLLKRIKSGSRATPAVADRTGQAIPDRSKATSLPRSLKTESQERDGAAVLRSRHRYRPYLAPREIGLIRVRKSAMGSRERIPDRATNGSNGQEMLTVIKKRAAMPS